MQEISAFDEFDADAGTCSTGLFLMLALAVPVFTDAGIRSSYRSFSDAVICNTGLLAVLTLSLFYEHLMLAFSAIAYWTCSNSSTIRTAHNDSTCKEGRLKKTP